MGRFSTDNKSFRMFSVQIIPKWIENVHVNFGILCISIILDMIGTNIQLLVHSALPFICSIAHLGPDYVQLNCRNKSKLLTESKLWITVFQQNWVYLGQVHFSFVCCNWLFPPWFISVYNLLWLQFTWTWSRPYICIVYHIYNKSFTAIFKLIKSRPKQLHKC